MTRGRNDHLTNRELRDLRADVIAGMTIKTLAKRYNLSERNVYMRKAEILGKPKHRIYGEQHTKKAAPVEKRPMQQPNAMPSVMHKLMGGR